MVGVKEGSTTKNSTENLPDNTDKRMIFNPNNMKIRMRTSHLNINMKNPNKINQ